MATDRPEQITDPVAFHGEGPVWSPDWGGLRCVDLLAGDVLAVDTTSGAVRRDHVGAVAAALRPRAAGGTVLALERGFALIGPAGPEDFSGLTGGVRRYLGDLWDADAGVRMNDGGCDPDGRFYCGSMAYAETAGAGSLYRLAPDGTVSVVLTGVTVSNGLAWSPDGARAYYVDSATSRVDVFDYDSERGLRDRWTLVTVPEEAGAPDGLTVDADGYLWVALWGGGAVHRYSPTGRLDGIVPLPVPRVTACTFGGDRLDTLYITTSQVGTDLTRYPAAGAVFALAPGVRGQPVQPFTG
ncbi:SMP-30/gluconolactonase/LRE family protein [Parafrankia sp. BMG5.11]|uniref:SMP-30/gluconolactonase/LRE family protein n=1 Tax=Parafrankia sp. BMG5.11 TaxID=222540 RepID=UPI0010406DB9|nr:SMP-30/gluconolactonase/LRE family protein [Parafrankia sp. BMG5.11]TCJ37732.1 SMP-30/gluconolactonase/LRE family protein [Parafrankia sp. BMG5.11]